MAMQHRQLITRCEVEECFGAKKGEEMKYSDRNLYPQGIMTGEVNVDWVSLKPYLDFVVLQAGELQYWDQDIKTAINPNLSYNVAACALNGLPVIINWKHNPQYYADCSAVNPEKLAENFPIDKDKQILALVKACENKLYHAIQIDIQRYWIDQAAHEAGADKGVIPPSVILFTTRYFIQSIKYAMQIGKLRKVPIIFYSAPWFIENYSKDTTLGSLFDVTPNMDTSEAAFSIFTGDHEWNEVRTILIPPDTKKPTGLNGNLKFWHYAGNGATLPLSGTKRSKVDLFLSMIDRKSLYSYLSFAGGTLPTDPVVPPSTPTMDVLLEKVNEALARMSSTADVLQAATTLLSSVAVDIAQMSVKVDEIRSKFS
jgi:hypothetical protein